MAYRERSERGREREGEHAGINVLLFLPCKYFFSLSSNLVVGLTRLNNNGNVLKNRMN